MINFDATTAALIDCMEQAGYATSTIHTHQLCFDELRKHLSVIEAEFSMEAAIEWLNSRKSGWTDGTYKRYRIALYRIAQFMECGNIDRISYCHSNYYAYHDADVSFIKLTDNYRTIMNEFRDKLSRERGEKLAGHYAGGCADFLLFISENGYADPAELTIECIHKYSLRIRGQRQTPDAKRKYVSDVNNLLAHFHEQGYIPHCYLSVVYLDQETNIEALRLTSSGYPGSAFQPSKALDIKADGFMSKLENRRYCKASRKRLIYVINEFFKFLEINRIEYSPEASLLWLNLINEESKLETRRQIITLFDEYMETGNINDRKKAAWKPLAIESLPDWSRCITDEFLSLRQREGWARTTVVMSRSACVRFFRFLDKKAVAAPSEITPALVKEFHDTDPHTTPSSRNMYSAGVRKLLAYMAERNLVQENLYLAVSTQYASCRKIVSIMSPEMVTAVFDYRKNAKGPLELRNTAIVLMGLRMGLRASDIVNLKIGDIDWEKRKLSIIQTKTRRAVSLHVPTDVGNSIYKYITQGRPLSGASGLGYVFIAHRAPFSWLSSAVCKKALDGVLSAYGLRLESGQGFHITRRTFATRLLTARTPVDTIADSLGHASRDTVDSYLAHDEDGMRLCPLSFEIGGAQ